MNSARLWRLAMLVALLAALGVLSVFAHERPFFPWDVTIADWVLEIPGPGVGRVMEVISWPGNRTGILVSGFVAAAVAARLLGWRAGLLVLSVALIINVNEQFKELIDRPRPGELVGIGDRSFPSGHTLHAVLLPGVIWLLAAPRMSKQSHRMALAAAALLWAVLVGLSRIHLEEHWPSDVLGSYLVGASILWVMAWLTPVLRRAQLRSQDTGPPTEGAS